MYCGETNTQSFNELELEVVIHSVELEDELELLEELLQFSIYELDELDDVSLNVEVLEEVLISSHILTNPVWTEEGSYSWYVPNSVIEYALFPVPFVRFQ